MTQAGNFYGQAIDLFVWDGGIGNDPGAVLATIPNVVPPNIPMWPAVGQNDFEINLSVSGPFTAGFWSNNPLSDCIFVGMDEDGLGGYPWTCIAPGIGYPTGWQHPNLVMPDVVSLGIGVYYTYGGSSPTSEGTWGSIKALFE